MSKSALHRVTSLLPHSFRREIDGYVESVEGAARSIFASAKIPWSSSLQDQLLFLAGIRRLWSLVDGQLRILRTTLSLMGRQDIAVVRLGSQRYGFTSSYYRQLQDGHRRLEELLRETGVFDLVRERSLVDAVTMLAEQEHDGHTSS